MGIVVWEYVITHNICMDCLAFKFDSGYAPRLGYIPLPAGLVRYIYIRV